MLYRLIKPYVACQEAGGRDNLVSSPPAIKYGWSLIAVIWVGLVLFNGCGGPSQEVLKAQALAQSNAQNSSSELQNRLMLPAVKTSPPDYKDYKVGSEDLLVIEIYGQEKMNREVRVNGQGEISMPLVGVVKVADLTTQEIEKRLVELYGANYLRKPQVMVGVKEFRHRRVSVTGAVAKPGTYEIIGPRTLLEVLSLAGGFSSSVRSEGQPGDIVNVTRYPSSAEGSKESGTSKKVAPQAETMVIDLRRLVSGQSPELNITVHSGDVISVPFASTAYVLGAVKKPGNIAVKENLTVSQAVAMAGGIDPLLGTDKITIMRFDDKGSPISIKTNLSSIVARNEQDIPVKGSDVIVVSESLVKKSLFLIKQLLPAPSIPVL